MHLEENVLNLINDQAILRGSFTLRSGRKSSWYIDKYKLTTMPHILEAVGQEMSGRVLEDTNKVAGAELGGIPLVSVVSIKTGLPSVFIRNQKKNYGTERQVEGSVGAGDRFILLEDIVTTGGQSIEAARLIESLGGIVQKIVAIFDRQEGGRENIENSGYLFDSLITRDMLGLKL